MNTIRPAHILITALLGAAPLCAAVVAAPQSAEINAAGSSAQLSLALAMERDGNWRGAFDQLRLAMSQPLTPADAETALWHSALVARHIPGEDARALLSQFLTLYPASPQRPLALMELAGCDYDEGQYGAALMGYDRVDPESLSGPDADMRSYRRAYCLMRLGRYDEAEAAYRHLAIASAYRTEARFYLGYIAYVRGDWDKALAEFRQVPRTAESPCGDAPYYMAQIYFNRRDWAAAQQQCAALMVRKEIPGEYAAETYRIMGESTYFLGDHAEGVKYLKKYLSLTDEPLPSATYLLGVETFNDGDYSRAVELLTPASSEMSALGQSALLYLGQCYMKQDNWDAASLALRKASNMDFDTETREMAFYDCAVAGMRGGRTPFGSSVQLFEEFLNRYPDSRLAPEVRDYLVTGYVNDANYPAALTVLNAVSNPTRAQQRARQQVLYLLGSRRLQSGDAAAAEKYLAEAQSLKSLDARTSAEATLWLGEALYRQGQYRRAAAEFNRYINSGYASGANAAMAWYDLGYSRFALKEFSAAQKDFSKFLDKAPKGVSAAQRADALCRLGDCRYYSHDFSGAADDYAEALTTAPDAGDYPLYQQALMKGLQGDNAGKIELLSRMTSRYPASALVPSALLESAEAWAAQGNTTEALNGYDAVANRFPKTAQGRRGMLLAALTYLNAGRTAEAKARYRRVIELYPTSEEARAAADDLKHISADEGSLGEYSAFIASVPDAPAMGEGEASALLLEAARRAVDEGRADDALARATELTDNYPDSPEAVAALAIRAEAEEARGMAPKALETYRTMAQKASTAADANTARLGVMRLSFAMDEFSEAIEAADALLGSSAPGADVKEEASFTKALALSRLKRSNEAADIWRQLAVDPQTLWGAKSLYYLAQQEFDAGQTRQAETDVQKLIDANPPHDYWLARGFILLSDIRTRQGNKFEAAEYLRSLRDNFPGDEADIMQMIDTRLSSLK